MGLESRAVLGGWGVVLVGWVGTNFREEGGREKVPGLGDDDVVDGLVPLAEAREADLDDHVWVVVWWKGRAWCGFWARRRWGCAETLRREKKIHIGRRGRTPR